MATAVFRAGVVAVVMRSDGAVMVFERGDRPGHWQLPQGGIEDDESPRDAVWRELGEETGLGDGQVRLVAEHPDWVPYEWPRDAWKPPRRGAIQRWFFFEVHDDAVIPVPDQREFRDWSWTDRQSLLDRIVPFKRAAYRTVLGG